MLTTSASQYLQPDYIQPLPSSLDVNNSPLALLAQTCSSIGKDPAPSSKTTTGSSSASDKKTSHNSSSNSTAANSSSSGTGVNGSMKEGSGNRAKSESPSTKNVSVADDRSRSRPSASDRKDSSSSSSSSSTSQRFKGTPPKMGFRVPRPPSKDGTGGDRSNSDQEPGHHSARDSYLSASAGSGSRLMGHGSSTAAPTSLTSSSSFSSSSSSSSSSSTSSGLGNSSGKMLGAGNSCSSMLLELNQEALSKGANQASLHASLHPFYSSLKLQDSLQALHGGLAPSLGAVAPGGCTLPPFLGYPLSLDPLAAAYSASLAAAAHCNGFSGLSSQKSPVTAGGSNSTPIACSAASLSPYVSYARVKTASGATTLVPFCKDPYCAHCQLTLHGAQLSATVAAAACSGPGCSQCHQHDKSLNCSSSTSLTSPSSMAVPSPQTALSFYPAPCSTAPGMSTLCSHVAFGGAAAAAAAALQSPHGGPLVTPYVCNWVQGSDYCGKRFTSSEDLLQHLRSHTSAAAGTDATGLVSPFNATAPGSGGGAGGGAGFPLSALGFPLGNLLGCASQLPGVASLSPGLFSASTYPRSLSPNTLLAAARYHPYKPPPPHHSLSVLPGSSGPILPGAFSLAAYYSPYAFYGHRLGAAAAAGP